MAEEVPVEIREEEIKKYLLIDLPGCRRYLSRVVDVLKEAMVRAEKLVEAGIDLDRPLASLQEMFEVGEIDRDKFIELFKTYMEMRDWLGILRARLRRMYEEGCIKIE